MRLLSVYYDPGMTNQVPSVLKGATNNRRAITETEVWYLKNYLVLWRWYRQNHQRAPNVGEFSRWYGRAATPCYMALKSIASKGYLRQHRETRRFIPTKKAAPYAQTQVSK